MSLLQALKLPSRPPAPGQPQAAANPVTLAIAPPKGPFEPNSEHKLGVVAFMADGKPQNYTSKAKWTSSNPALVQMLPGGIAKVGLGAGPVTITAAAPGGKPRDSVSIKVQAKLQDIVITPKNPLVEVGETQIMTATGVFADGSTEDLTAFLDWSADDKGKVVHFPQNGGAWDAKAPGTPTLAATDRRTGVTGHAKATVVAKGKGPKLVDIAIEPLDQEIKHGEAVQFRAFGIFDDKSRHEVTEKVQWRTSKKEVLVMDDDIRGLARPRLQSGTSLVAAVDEKANKGKSTTVDVDFPGIRRIDVAPKEITVVKGEAEKLTMTATLHNGGQMRVNDLVQFTRIDTNVAVVQPGGAFVIGVDPGHTEVEVFEPSSKSTATFEVTVPPLRMIAIVVIPSSQTIHVGDRIDFIAMGRLEDLTTTPLGRPGWSSSDDAVVEVDQTGRATAKAQGDVVIHIQDASTGVMGHATVQVDP